VNDVKGLGLKDGLDLSLQTPDDGEFANNRPAFLNCAAR
jgi:hypothetical protein